MRALSCWSKVQKQPANSFPFSIVEFHFFCFPDLFSVASCHFVDRSFSEK
jgi:hypothetical protein